MPPPDWLGPPLPPPPPPPPWDDVDEMDEAGDDDVCETGPWAAGDEPAGTTDDRTDFMTAAADDDWTDGGGGDREPGCGGSDGGGAADVVRSCGELMPFGVPADAVTSYLHWTPPAADGMPITLLLSADVMGDTAPPPGDGRPPT